MVPRAEVKQTYFTHRLDTVSEALCGAAPPLRLRRLTTHIG
jgi:hypothetical protein